MYDLIGDIHGHADKLKALLLKLNYREKNGSFSHESRKAIFVGDYIDRGPQIKETLRIVRGMVESDSAIALMGNHEYNAICFHFEEKTKGGHLRKHKIKNIIQHYQTLLQFQNRQDEYNEWIDWFKTLPLFYETNEFRAVHACWDKRNMSFLQKTLKVARLTDDLIHESVIKDTQLYKVIDETLKGREIRLPEGLDFVDKDGAIRHDIRIKWWEDPSITTYKEISIEPLPNLPEKRIDTSLLKSTDYYTPDEKAVFFGHYWLKGNPSLYRNNICCLDYSVAKGGVLTAYRFDGEKTLENGKFVYV